MTTFDPLQAAMNENDELREMVTELVESLEDLLDILDYDNAVIDRALEAVKKAKAANGGTA